MRYIRAIIKYFDIYRSEISHWHAISEEYRPWYLIFYIEFVKFCFLFEKPFLCKVKVILIET